MRFARKFYLVNEQQYNKLSNSYVKSADKNEDLLEHPNEKGAKAEHIKMKNILSNDLLTDYEKVIDYSQSLQKYLNHMKDSLEITKSQAILGGEKSALAPKPDNKDEKVSSMKQEGDINSLSQDQKPTLPKSEETIFSPHNKKGGKTTLYTKGEILSTFDSADQRKRAETILNAIHKSPVISWNTKTGSVKIHGSQLSKSNITQLLRTAVGVKGAEHRTRSWMKFNSVLQDLGLTTPNTTPQSGRGLNLSSTILCSKWHCLKE